MGFLWIFLSALVGLIIGGLLGTSKRADLVDEVRILRAKLYKAEKEIERLEHLIDIQYGGTILRRPNA